MVSGGQTAYLAADPSSEETFTQIKYWISSCADDHTICRLSDCVCLPLRVIDVGAPGIEGAYSDPFLSVGTNRPGRYATLSYRWGGSLTLKTELFTLESRKASLPLDSMPRTFQDAVNVTRRLGIRYLWIDALCIVQDSLQDWQEQSAIMGQIYADAWLNISVNGASDPQSGFLKKRNILEIRSCRHPSLLGDSTSLGTAAANVAKAICPNAPRHDQVLYRDVLNSRGWILQERVLSKRTLHFGLYEISWECLSGSASEREPETFQLKSSDSKFDIDSQGRKGKLNIIRSGVQYLYNQSAEELLDLLGPEGFSPPCHDEGHSRWVLRNLSKSPKERETFQYECSHYHPQPVYAPPSVTGGQFVAAHHLWYLLIEEYTLRSLTISTDKLPAVSGLARIFQTLFGTRSKYIAGIWSSDILSGLTWSRSVQFKVEDTGKRRMEDPPPPSSFYRAPSFSWASVDSPVHFSVVQRNRLTGDDCYSAKILHIDSIPTGLSPLAEVSGGSLKLRAWAIPFHRILEESGGCPKWAIFDRDDVPHNPLDKRILCVSIRNISRGYLGERPSVLRQCLLLFPTSPGKDIYRRVGYWEVKVPEPPRPWIVNGVDILKNLERSDKTVDHNKPPYEGWEEMDVTIV
jgi:hypothetical protein